MAETTIKGLTITGGATSAAISGSSSDLTIDNSVITGNAAGGISSSIGTITVTNSTISDNSGASGGGGISMTNGTVTVSNSTISGNSATSVGGGILVTAGTINLTNTTVSGNSAQDIGGGAFVTNGTINLINSTVSGNVVYSATSIAGGVGGTLATINATNSIVLGNSAAIGAGISHNVGFADQHQFHRFRHRCKRIRRDRRRDGGGLLADNGGPVKTIALKDDVTNPALDAGDDTLDTATDARGLARFDKAGVANNGANISDLGAFELVPPEAPSLVVTILTDMVDAFDGETSLREAIVFADNPARNVGSGDADNDSCATTRSPSPRAFRGGTIMLGGSHLRSTRRSPSTMAPRPTSRSMPDVFPRDSMPMSDTTLKGLTITGRQAPMQVVRRRHSRDRLRHDLTIEDSVISGNSTAGSDSDGGGILQLRRSDVS